MTDEPPRHHARGERAATPRTPHDGAPSTHAPEELRAGPIGGQLWVVARGVFLALRLPALAARYDSTAVLAVFSFINGCISIALMAAVALLSHQPFVFPSLGPTAFLFFYTPLAPAASPRNAFIGHLIGVVAGWSSLAAFHLLHAGPAMMTGVTAARIGAAALSLGLTSGLMVLLRAPHPPAGATTLIISLGLLRTIEEMAVLMAAVVLLTVQAMVINRLAGVPYPVWGARTRNESATNREKR
ncbi:MAG TPA: HPP family protein [Gemmatimonadaceae bacterium]